MQDLPHGGLMTSIQQRDRNSSLLHDQMDFIS